MKTVHLISLGCPKNLVDSEVMLGLLKGHVLISDPEKADVIIVNTCGFLQSAVEEALDDIFELNAVRKPGSKFIVTGCMVERYREALTQELPEIQHFLGPGGIWRINDIVTGEDLGKIYLDKPPWIPFKAPRSRFTPHTYLKIADGCDRHCTFCIIPQLRGNHNSRDPESLFEEALNLVSEGVVELNLISQETTAYRHKNTNLAGLCKKLLKIPDLEWLRVLYAHPNSIEQDFLDLMSTEKRLCSYLDVPIQHASSSVLKRMGRGHDKSQLEAIIANARKTVPNLALRTTVIVGFPGESQDDFDELLDFIEENQFDRLGAFVWSPEEGSSASLLPDRVDPDLAQERLDELLNLQAEIASERNSRFIDQVVPVIIDGPSEEHEFLLQGRMMNQAPDVDGVVHLGVNEQKYQLGKIYLAKITGTTEVDFAGELLEPSNAGV